MPTISDPTPLDRLPRYALEAFETPKRRWSEARKRFDAMFKEVDACYWCIQNPRGYWEVWVRDVDGKDDWHLKLRCQDKNKRPCAPNGHHKFKVAMFDRNKGMSPKKFVQYLENNYGEYLRERMRKNEEEAALMAAKIVSIYTDGPALSRAGAIRVFMPGGRFS